MEGNFVEDGKFEKIDFTINPLQTGEYEGCEFLNCNFSNTDLSNINFSECHFTGCNLSMAKLVKTSFQDTKFKDCKLLGLHFQDCNAFLFTVDFDNCFLNLSSFYKLKLKKIRFKDCSMHEVDFTETDLSAAILDNCDLLRATFDNTILEKTDFRAAFNYSIDPERNRVKKAKFSTTGISGLLDKYDIEID
ncbi:MAG: pentapeptide repeat-containing protein [Bacteroidota bacterium]